MEGGNKWSEYKRKSIDLVSNKIILTIKHTQGAGSNEVILSLTLEDVGDI
jgi:hypothetical protein